MRKTWIQGAGMLLLGFSVAACGAKRQAGWDRATTEAQGDVAEVLADAEVAWAERYDEAQLRKAIGLYEKAVAINPAQRDVLIRLARAWYLLGDGFARNDKDAQLEYFDTSASWGERAMATYPDFLRAVRDERRKVEDAIALLDENYVGAVYWSASAIGKWARLKGFTTLLSQKSKVQKFMEWCTETDADFYYAGPPRYWGAYYSVAPGFAGGSTERSLEEFEKSLAQYPDFLGTKVLMADTYATKIQDRALYERLLNEVIAADPTVIPEIEPEQRIEQDKARELLALTADRFASLESPTRTAALGQ